MKKSYLLSFAVMIALLSCSVPATVSSGSASDKGSENSNSKLILSKKITQEIAEQTRIEPETISSLDRFFKQSITELGSDGDNYVFSPLSYYLGLSSLYSLSEDENQKTISSLNANSKSDLKKLSGDVAKRVFSGTGYEIHSQTANLIIDDADAFDDEAKSQITDELFCSYLGRNYSESELNEWVSSYSGGVLSEYQGPEIEKGTTTFLNGVYFDMPYETAFDEEKDRFLPWSGKGNYRFMHGETSTRYAYKSDSYDAFELSLSDYPYKIRFVQPHGKSLREFFDKNVFSACFIQPPTSARSMQFVTMPYVYFSSHIDLLPLAKKQGFFSSEEEIIYRNVDFAPKTLIQSTTMQFAQTGVRAISITQESLIPAEQPELSFVLDSPYAFEILGRDNLILFHGEISTLEALATSESAF
ncbi:MAG: hypothetical protein J5736_02870 [Bacilli bacterium]|nr:hypothetical protein [Bacilli bacterium]